MKRTVSIFLTFFFAMFICTATASALELGKNITIFDNQQAGGWYYGTGQGNEDEETEPGTAQAHVWDLEGMFLNGTVLSLVGEWDFTATTLHPVSDPSYDRDGDNRYTSGDLFIDVAGVNLNGYYGYDYVFDVDWSAGTFSLFSLANTAAGDYWTTTYKSDSNPWKFHPSATPDAIYSGNFTEERGLTNGETGFLGDNIHYMVSFDLSPIMTALQLSDMGFTAHFTMECGNDNLMGSAPVPEPATIMLMGFGLVCMAGFTRKKFKFERNI